MSQIDKIERAISGRLDMSERQQLAAECSAAQASQTWPSLKVLIVPFIIMGSIPVTFLIAVIVMLVRISLYPY